MNLSSRAIVGGADSAHSFIAGFVVSGSTPKRLLVRAVGPALNGFGVQNALASPQLVVTDAIGNVVVQNSGWSGADVANAASAAGAFALTAGTHDAATIVTLPPGNYSMQVQAASGSGVALAEVYDLNADAAPLINISTRAYVDTGDNVLVAGFVVNGTQPKRLLIRGVGPGLAQFGVSGTLTDPRVTVYQNSSAVAQNDDWETGQAGSAGPAASASDISTVAGSVGAFKLSSGSKDAALVVTLSPGAYTAVVNSANGAAGAGLVEVYELP